MESDLILQDLFQNISKSSIAEKAGSRSPSVSKKSSKRKKKRDTISEDSSSSEKGMEDVKKSKKKKKCKDKSNNDSNPDSDIKLKKKKSKKSKRSQRSRSRSDDESNENHKRDIKHKVTKGKEDPAVKDQPSLGQVKDEANKLDVKELNSTMTDIPLPHGVATSLINTIPLPSSCNSVLKEEKTKAVEDDISTEQSLSESKKSTNDVNIADAFGVLLSKVIEEVDAENRLKENYESGEISSDNAEESPSTGKSKKKKQKRDKSSKEGKKKRRSRSSSHEKRDTQIDRSSSSSKGHKERSRSPERNKHHDKAVSKHHKSRSRSPRHSDRYRHNSRDYSSRGDSRRSDRRRSRSRDRKHSSEHYSRYSRSPDRRYRDRRSSDRPFRVAPPRSSRDRSRSTSPRFDKAKLLSIARQNLEKMKSAGILPENVTQNEVWRTIQAGGKTVKDLTDFCQRLAQASHESDSSISNKDDIRHPFQVKVPVPEKASGVFQFNIKNAITLPVRNADEIKQSANKLKEQFPVSSGTVHRKQVGEDEWVPVIKENEPKVMHQPKVTISDVGHRMVANQLGIKQEPKAKQTNAVAPIPRTQEQTQASSISELVAKRIAAMKKFQDNPNDFVAKKELEDVEAQTRQWVYRKEREFEVNKPPNFIDFSTAPQSWASKAQFANAAPVTSGPGLKLLQKMGWQQGEGLGRNKDGTLEPLTLDIKMDKKGLVSREEVKPCRLPITKAAKSISGKHPVTSLNEICVKRRWPMPHFEQIFEAGPDHLKQFLFKVTVNNIDYRPVMASSTKKEAKAQCAAVCLQALGLLPT